MSYIAELKVIRVFNSCKTKEQSYLVKKWARRLFEMGVVSALFLYEHNLFFSPQDRAEF